MIDRVIAILERIPLPSPIKEDLIAAIRQIPEPGASISQQNGALYRACGVIKATLPDKHAQALCYHLCDQLTVPVSEKVVRASIRKNRNTPVIVSPDTFADFINEDMTFSA